MQFFMNQTDDVCTCASMNDLIPPREPDAILQLLKWL